MGLSESFQPIGQDHPDLLAFLAKARSEEPVFYWEEQGIWVVTRYDDVDRVMADGDCFSAEGNLGVMNDRYCPAARDILSQGVDWLTIPQVNGAEGETHARLRHVMQKILAPARVKRMEPSVRNNVVRLIDAFAAKKSCEFVSEFAYPLPVNVIFDVIGFSSRDHDLKELALWSDDTFRLWLAPLTPDEQVTCARHAIQFQDYIRSLLADRRTAPRDDLLSDFVQQIDDGSARISEEEVIMMFPMNIIGAGHETTKAALTNAVYYLLENPDRWQAIIDDPSTIPNVVEETLRYDGSVFAWYRVVVQETQLGGKALKPGDKVMGVFGSANHDEAKFADAGQFCPARKKVPKQLTFSTGRHFCVGAPLARLEMKVALEELSTRLPGLHMVDGQVIEHMESVATRVITGLQLAWD